MRAKRKVQVFLNDTGLWQACHLLEFQRILSNPKEIRKPIRTNSVLGNSWNPSLFLSWSPLFLPSASRSGFRVSQTWSSCLFWHVTCPRLRLLLGVVPHFAAHWGRCSYSHSDMRSLSTNSEVVWSRWKMRLLSILMKRQDAIHIFCLRWLAFWAEAVLPLQYRKGSPELWVQTSPCCWQHARSCRLASGIYSADEDPPCWFSNYR